MPNGNYRHIYLPGPTATQGFTNPRQGGSRPRLAHRDRQTHSAYLRQRLLQAWNEAEGEQAVLQVERTGVYLEFESEPGFDLAIRSLERLQSGIRLLNVRQETVRETERTLATVYVPHNRRGYFVRKIQMYATEIDRRSNRPKNAKMVDSISDIRRAVVESFWRSDERDLVPGDDPSWVEVWLSSDSEEVMGRFELLLREVNVESREEVLTFPERAVKLILVSHAQLERLIEFSDDIAEFRASRTLALLVLQRENEEQLEIVEQLLARTRLHETGSVICILDSGVNNGHLLLQPVLDHDDLHTADPAWGVADHDGHGTLMAGMAAFGDLLELLNDNSPVRIGHRLESAKILPPPPATNLKRLWGYMTAQGISRAEIQAPGRRRVSCMAITSIDDRDRGRPSSWSATLDGLSSGYEDDTHRLIVVSAGNVSDPDSWRNYPVDNLTNEVHDPGQAWNALTVGAFTAKTRIVDPILNGYVAIAPEGGLSPYSTTSVDWPARKWPIKPDVVFEGGNVARAPDNSVVGADELQLISTYYDPQVAQFASFNATSAACAQAAWMGARIQADYPNAWPETIRALIVHTADWTEAMKRQFLPDAPSKADYAALLRICGYGVPNLGRALTCAANSLTLISQAEMQPFDRQNGRYVTNEMHLYDLPWPSDVLDELRETPVEMRVTLSYFIEPGPGEVGWENRYRYASHALRFSVNGPQEDEGDFVRRVNRQAREDGEHPGTVGPNEKWVIGEARNVGSIHSDVWQGTAADLATSNLIAVYPAVGWWRERHHLNRWNRRCRYTLVVSIHTPEEQVDIYIPVAVQLGITIPVTVNARPQA